MPCAILSIRIDCESLQDSGLVHGRALVARVCQSRGWSSYVEFLQLTNVSATQFLSGCGNVRPLGGYFLANCSMRLSMTFLLRHCKKEKPSA